MKRFPDITLLFIPVLLYCFTTSAQNNSTLPDLASARKITWFGLDFSRFHSTSQVQHDKNTRISFRSGLNAYMISDKINIAGLLHVDTLLTDLTVVQKRNNEFSAVSAPLDESSIKEMILDYHYPKSEGIGFVLIVDKMDRATGNATAWATFFDLETKEVIQTEELRGKGTSGNPIIFWSGAFSEILTHTWESISR